MYFTKREATDLSKQSTVDKDKYKSHITKQV